MPFHDDTAPERMVVPIENRERLALLRRENTRQHGVAVFIEAFGNFCPVDRSDARDGTGCLLRC